jgi:hypothetical protein
MPFSPSNTILNTLNEFENLSHTITYTSPLGASGATGIGTSYPVTITAVEPHAQITIVDNNISGYYRDVFNNEIYYRIRHEDPSQDEFFMVHYFNEIDPEQPYEIYHYNVDTTTRKTFSYIATANGESQTYTINVDNDWTTARDQLLLYLSPQQQVAGVQWINTNANTVTWKNDAGSTIIWNNNL